jgi:hypothetical protein
MSKDAFDAGYKAGFERGFDMAIAAYNQTADLSEKIGRVDLSVVLKAATESLAAQKPKIIAAVMGEPK